MRQRSALHRTWEESRHLIRGQVSALLCSVKTKMLCFPLGYQAGQFFSCKEGSHCSWPQPQRFEWKQDLLFFIFLTIAIMDYGFRAPFQIASVPSRLLTDISHCFMAWKLQVVCYHSKRMLSSKMAPVFLALVPTGLCNVLCLSGSLLLNHKVRWCKTLLTQAMFSSWLWRSRVYYSCWKKDCRRALWYETVRTTGATNDCWFTTTDNTGPSSSTTGRN